jgi:uncharacterized glyoxalase superfamily protein PhnB
MRCRRERSDAGPAQIFSGSLSGWVPAIALPRAKVEASPLPQRRTDPLANIPDKSCVMNQTTTDLLVNIDVPDLIAAIAFYTEAFGLNVTRRIGAVAAELGGWPVRVYLLQKPEATFGAGESPRHYDRHWTPVHLDIVVRDLETALSRALAAGARAETEIRTEAWGKIVGLADPFGHGVCLLQFLGRGYDEIAEAPNAAPTPDPRT